MKHELRKGLYIFFSWCCVLPFFLLLHAFFYVFKPTSSSVFHSHLQWPQPLRVGVSLSQLLFQALTLPLNLQPWFKSLQSWNDCLLVCAHQRLLSLWSLLMNYTGPFGIASPLLQLPPGLPCMSLWQTPFGVTDTFAASPTCLSSSWSFDHLQKLQMELPSLPTEALADSKFQVATSFILPWPYL